MPAVHLWWTYHTPALQQRPATLLLIRDTRLGNFLSFNNGELHRDGWSLELDGQSLALSFYARGRAWIRHNVRLERTMNGWWMGYDDTQRLILLEPMGGLLSSRLLSDGEIRT